MAVPIAVVIAEALFATDWSVVGARPWGCLVVGALVMAAPLALTARWRAPWPVFVTVLALAGLAGVAFFGPGPLHAAYLSFIPPAVALYALAASRPAADARLALGLTAGPIALQVGAKVSDGAFVWASPEAVSFALFLGLLFGLCAYGGHRARLHVERIDDLEAERIELVVQERARLARELHDIVSHAVSIIVLQAAGARTVLDDDPERAADALSSIETMGRQAMGELRRLLVVLRDAPDEDLPIDQHRLDQLDDLVAAVRAAGNPVEVTVAGVPTVLDPSVEHSAFRVVQEALTNACKHGTPGRPTEVRIDWTDDLLIEVANRPEDGGGRAGRVGRVPRSGFGLIGLRERVAMVGGALEAGLDPDGRYRVEARLPVPGADPDARAHDEVAVT